MCSAGSSAGRQIQPWEYARGWPRAKPQQRGSARLCPQRGADRGAAGLLSRGTKVGALGSIRHSHFTTEVPIYVGFFFLLISFLLRNLVLTESTNAVILINPVFTHQELKKIVEFSSSVMILKIHSSKIVTWFCSQRDLFLENITRIHLLLHFHFLWSSFTRNLNFDYMFMGKKMVFIHMWQVHVKMLSHYVGKSYVTSEAKP